MEKLRIGFPLARGGGGPTIFMSRLRQAVQREHLARSSYFFDPFVDILICANSVRNPWRKPYVLRLDGIAFDLALGASEIERRNTPIFESIDQAAGLIFQADFSRKLISHFHPFSSKPITIIPNGVDLAKFNPDGPDMREQLSIPRSALVFISSAKWRAHKRLASILRAFRQYCSSTGEQAHLLILGKLDEPPLFVPERVHLVGYVEHAELPTWYRTGDICIFLSWLDNCPNTVVEALASGLPVLCTNQGGTGELLELTEGGIVVAADEEFRFTTTDLYRPPEPDPDKILAGMRDIVARRNQLSAGIKREKIGIDFVANRYVEFARSVQRIEVRA